MAEMRHNSGARAAHPPAGDRAVRSPAKRLPPGQASHRSPTPIPGEIQRPRHNPWVIALTVTMATFMEALDTSIANVALPHIAGSSWRQCGREHLGPDFLSGFQRDRAAGECMAFDNVRAQALLHELRCAFHGEFAFVRLGAEPGDSDRFASSSRRGWRRFAAE